MQSEIKDPKPAPRAGALRNRGCLRHNSRPVRWIHFALGVLLGHAAIAAPLRIVIIGDSLSAEYDALPNIPGIEDPTAYAAITVTGWESRCWVEVLGQMRTNTVGFGGYKPDLPGWNDLRFSGHEYDFAIPGFEASQYEDIVNSSLFSNPQYLTFKLTLSDVLQHKADAAVVWIGGNEFRAKYGYLYDGGDPASLISNLRHDIGEILDFVRAQRSTLPILAVNLPDLGATPTKQAAHPDPAKRERVTQATELANQAIADQAASRGIPVADVYATTRRLIAGEKFWFGPVDLHPGSDPDNNPRYAFTRDGLHPNTGLQSEIARIIIGALRDHFGASIPPISDSEVLQLLGLSPLQPYLDWMAAQQLNPSGMGDDPDGDGLVNLAEYTFNLDPKVRNGSPITADAHAAPVTFSYRPDADRLRLVSVTPEWSTDLASWEGVPAASLTTNTNGVITIQFPPASNAGFLRLQFAVRPVE